MRNLEELNLLRERTRKELAVKIISICQYAKDNGFDSILSTYEYRYTNAWSGLYCTMLAIHAEDYVIFCLEYAEIEKNDVESVSGKICTNNMKNPKYCGCDYWCGEYKKPSINQCKDWIDKKIATLAELEDKEIAELKKMLEGLSEKMQ